MTLDDVEHFADEDDGGVALLPVVFEDSVAERIEEQVGMAEAIVVDEDFLHQHGRVTDILLLVRDKAIHVLVHLLDEALELLRADGRNVQEDQNEALLFTVLHGVQSLEDFV